MFPFDKIKIDQSFVRDLPTKKDSTAIVRAIIGVASSLDMVTTAEGVEQKSNLPIYSQKAAPKCKAT